MVPTYQVGDLGNSHSPHAILVAWTSARKRVLDVGCAQGYLARALADAGCVVDGIEKQPAWADEARRHCRQVINGSAEDAAAWSEIRERYDGILFGDVLEHLIDPESVLRRAKEHLAPDGRVIISLPNIANIKVRFGLLFGHFNYTDVGILDRTHLRFFTLRTARQMFERCGYRVLRMAGGSGGRTPGLLLRAWPSLFAPQFVFELASV